MNKLYAQLGELLIHHELLDSLGRGIKLITGNLDKDDEDYFNDKINSLVLDSRHIYQLERDQLTIIQSTLWTVNKTTLEMQENEQLLAKSFKYLGKLVEYNKAQIKIVK